MTPKQLRAELDSAVPGVVRQGVLPCRAQLQDANASHALSVIRVCAALTAAAQLTLHGRATTGPSLQRMQWLCTMTDTEHPLTPCMVCTARGLP